MDHSKVEQVELRKEKWSYEEFRDYLLALTQGSQFLLSGDDYPDQFELSEEWYKTIRTMRDETRIDGVERHAFIGFKTDTRAIYLPIIGGVGTEHSIPTEVIKKELEAARNSYIDGYIGDLHTHPETKKSGIPRVKRLFGPEPSASLSVADLYNLVDPAGSIFIRGVIEGDNLAFAFKTRESTRTDFSTDLLGPTAFEKYWYREYGYNYTGRVEKPETRELKPLQPRVQPKNLSRALNAAIAVRHSLELYKGKIGRPLIKVLP